MLLHELLLHAECVHHSRIATIDGALERTYGETTARVRQAANALVQAGLQRGQRVAIVCCNSSAYYEAYFAISFAGLIAVPVNTRLAAAEVEFVLQDCDCAAVICDAALVDLVGAQHGGRVFVTGSRAEHGWEEVIAHTEPLTEPVSGQCEDDVAHICYTGGTTGRPKGVMLSHRNVVASANNKIMLGAFARDDVWLHAAPMFHQADSWAVFSFTGLGARHVFMPAFDPTQALTLIETHGVTGLQLVPTMIFMMLDEPQLERYQLGSVRRILFGSAPMPVNMLARAVQAFGDVFQHIYGLTEAAGTVAAMPWPLQAHERERQSSCGQPIAGVRLRIRSAAGDAVPTGETGRLEVRGANVMAGYWRLPDESARALRDGWLDTGDIGRVDDEGFVFIVDRASDMIISGGENVYSTEVENVIYAHPCVAQAAVIGVPDEKWGEAVTAYVVLRESCDVDEAALIAHCRQTLARYKCPKSVNFVSALPQSAAGKILKQRLRDTRS